MERLDRWLLIGRLLQVLAGLLITGFSFAVVAARADESTTTMSAAGWLGVDITIFGALAIFDTRGNPNTNADVRLYLVLFILDGLALMCGFAASTAILIRINFFWAFDGVYITPILSGYIVSILVLVFIVRNARLWWRRLLSAPVTDLEKGSLDTKAARFEFRGPPENQHVFDVRSITSEDRGVPEIFYTENTSGPSSDAETKSNAPSMPMSFETTAHWSAVSGAVTLTFPNIMSRAPSVLAPSYITHMDAPSRS